MEKIKSEYLLVLLISLLIVFNGMLFFILSNEYDGIKKMNELELKINNMNNYCPIIYNEEQLCPLHSMQ